MALELLTVKQINELAKQTDTVNLLSNKAFIYTPSHEMSSQALQNARKVYFGNIKASKEEMIADLENELKIPANYLINDILGPVTYLQTTTHQPINSPTDIVGRFVTQLRNNHTKSTLETTLHNEIRHAIIHTKAFKHELTYELEGATNHVARMQDGLLISDATEQNYHNLIAFLDDYHAEVTSDGFYNNMQQAHNKIADTKRDIFASFLDN